MKIQTKQMAYEQVLRETPYEHKSPMKQSAFLRLLLGFLSFFWMLFQGFECTKIGMEKLKKGEPCLILMNHSSFIDLGMIARLFWDRPYQIVCTLDGFVGKSWLMRHLGCIPTKKFMTDMVLVRDLIFATKKLESSIVMYPEASYSFDGTATELPESMGKCLKLLQVPVIMIRSYGAFSRDPLYNGLQVRKVRISAEMEYLLSPEEIREKTVEELNEVLKEQFSFDHFKWQQENKVCIREPFRADHLNRVLYKCPHCQTEGKMLGKGVFLSCGHCGKRYELTEYGYMQAVEGETEFNHIPDWYRWERECVRKEILDGTYRLDLPVHISMLVNTNCLYEVGDGRLVHTSEGFRLDGCDGKLSYRQVPEASYSLYSDFYWYEIGDVISIGTAEKQFYCFPKDQGDVVAKTRLATEELYKLKKQRLI